MNKPSECCAIVTRRWRPVAGCWLSMPWSIRAAAGIASLKLLDLEITSLLPGGMRTAAELTALIEGSGFGSVQFHPTAVVDIQIIEPSGSARRLWPIRQAPSSSKSTRTGHRRQCRNLCRNLCRPPPAGETGALGAGRAGRCPGPWAEKTGGQGNCRTNRPRAATRGRKAGASFKPPSDRLGLMCLAVTWLRVFLSPPKRTPRRKRSPASVPPGPERLGG